MAMAFSRNLAIDLGTANTLIFIEGKGITLKEPSVVAINKNNKRVLAVGEEAKQMLGRTPENIEAIRPLKDGVIANFELAESMLRYFIAKVHPWKRFLKPKIIISVPSGITEVEKRVVKESAEVAGAKSVFLLEESMAAAIGAELPVQEPIGNMIVDIGGGTTEIAVISLAGIVYSKSIKVGGNLMDEMIAQYLKRVYKFVVGEKTAEDIKITLGSACANGNNTEERMVVKGLDLVNGMPKILDIKEDEVREAISDPLKAIEIAVKTAIDNTPPELVGDIMDKGIFLTGGGALLKRLDSLLEEATGVPVYLTKDPLTTTCMGTGKVLDNIALLEKVAC
jgi:rod shape-determining protein MreB